MPEILRGHLHGFIVYGASHHKPHDRPWATNEQLQSEHYAAHVPTGPSTQPLHFALPHILPQTILSSPYDQPDPLLAEQAAHRLFSSPQHNFAAAADAVARHHLRLPFDISSPQSHFTHLHGIGSWEGKLEPSMATVFHRPVTPSQLQKIAADVGSMANQEGILAFVPHRGGTEQMMHLRYPSHNPALKRLNPQVVGDIAQEVSDHFNQHYTVSPQGVKDYLMPGRSILPDTEGHTDVLVWVPSFVPFDRQQHMHEAVHQIAHNLGGRVQYWTGTGKIVGGMHPYEDSPDPFTDTQKRLIAKQNYNRAKMAAGPLTALHEGDVELPKFEATEPSKFARSPAKTGIVVRGVFYKPGSVIPDLIQSGEGEETPQPNPNPHLTLDDFKKRIRSLNSRGKHHANGHS